MAANTFNRRSRGEVLLRRMDLLLEISQAGGPPAEDVLQALVPLLTYQHVRTLHGQEGIDWTTGERHYVDIESRSLFQFDKRNRLVCMIGFRQRIECALTKLGYDCQFQDVSAPSRRPNALREDWDNLIRHYEFRPRQADIVAAGADMVSDPDRHGCIIQAPPGVGKSFLFSAFGLLYRHARIAVVIPGITNIQKSLRHMQTYLPLLGVVGGNDPRPMQRVTLFSADSLHKLQADDWDLVLVDEAHMLMSDERFKWLQAGVRRAKVIFFTATPEGRIDGTDIRLTAIGGEVAFSMTYQEAVQLGLVVQLEVHWHNVNSHENPAGGRDGTPKMRHGIWRHDHRNSIIADAARTHDENTQVLILVETFDHAVHLHQHLPEFQMCYASVDAERFARLQDNAMLPAGATRMTPQTRQQMESDFLSGALKKVISTTVWATGVSFDGLSVLVRADASNGNVIKDEQYPGRANRIDAGKAVGILHDFLDQFDSGFERRAKARKANYRKNGWVQHMPAGRRRGQFQ